MPLKKRYRMFIIDQHNVNPGSIPDDYFAFWKFDNSKNDETGNYNLSEVTIGSPSALTFENGRKGDANGSVRFNNTTTTARYLRKSVTRRSFNNGLTISIWIKVNATVPNVNRPIELDYGTNVGTYLNTRNLFSTPANYGEIYSGNVASNTISAASLGTNWRHHVVTVNGSGVTNYYIDNSQILTNVNLAKGSIRTILFGFGTGSAPVNGNIDDCRLYERVLTTDEITALYNE